MGSSFGRQWLPSRGAGPMGAVSGWHGEVGAPLCRAAAAHPKASPACTAAPAPHLEEWNPREGF